MDKNQFNKSQYREQLQETVKTVDSLRRDQEYHMDISLAEFVQKKYGVSMDAFYADLGINPSTDTIQNIFTMPDYSVRWLVPEIIRDALRLGLRKAPIYKSIIAAEETIKNPQVVLPHLNMSDAAPHYVGEAETIPLGNISYGQKTLRIRKMGRGIQIPYEVVNYVSINVVSIFLQDFGIRLGQAIDSLMIDVLINGEQADGSESAPVIGVTTANTLTYKDLLRIWVRMSRIGRVPNTIIGGEDAALAALDLNEFKTNTMGGTAPAGVPTSNKISLKTPIPNKSNYYIHGAVPANQQIIVDPSGAIIKYNAQPLLVESDKIISNQTMETYASLTTGFGILYRDARVILDSSKAFANYGFPSYMDVDTLEKVEISEI